MMATCTIPPFKDASYASYTSQTAILVLTLLNAKDAMTIPSSIKDSALVPAPMATTQQKRMMDHHV